MKMHKTISSKGTFIKESIKNFSEIGAVMPSSKFLAKEMVRHIENGYNGTVLEVGAGNGVFSRAILSKLAPQGRLICIELNENLARNMRENIHDKRLEVICGDAEYSSKYLRDRGIDKVDFVISGIPLGNLKRAQVKRLLHEIKFCLKDNGKYIQFQYFLADFKNIREEFLKVKVEWVFLNIPPAFVLVCRMR